MIKKVTSLLTLLIMISVNVITPFTYAESEVIEQPVVEEPVVEQPVVEEPVIEQPVIEEPIIEQPVIEEPVVDQPVVEEPIVEQPVIEKPVVEQPVVEEPVAEQPVVENPITTKEDNNLFNLTDLNKEESIETKSFEDCAEIENNSLIRWKKEINGCNNREIIIPSNIISIGASAFNGVTLTGLDFENQNTYGEDGAFSGAIFNGQISIAGNFCNNSSSALGGMTILENGDITIDNNTRCGVNETKINEGGKLTINNSTDTILKDSIISGTVEILGEGYLSYNSFENTIITERGELKIGEGVSYIYQDSFNNSKINADIEFPNIKDIYNSFQNSEINGSIIFSGNNKIDFGSVLSGSIISGDLLIICKDYSIGIKGFLNNAEILGNFKFINLSSDSIGVTNNRKLKRVRGNVELYGNRIYCSDSLKFGIGGNIKMEAKDYISFNGCFSGSNDIITGNIELIGGDITIDGKSFNEKNIKGNFNISGDSINIKGSSLGGMTISGDTKIIGNNVQISNNSFGSLKSNSLKIYADTFTGNQGSLGGINITGDTIISGNNVLFTDGLFGGLKSNSLKIYADTFTGNGGSLGGINITRDTIISGNNVLFSASLFGGLKSNSLKIYADTFTGNQGSLGGINITGDIIISGNNINLYGSSFGGANTKGNTIISGNNIHIQQTAFDGLKSSNLKIVGNNIISDNSGPGGLSITGTVNISGNYIFLGNSSFNNSNFGNLKINAKYFTGDAGTSGVFSGLKVKDDTEIIGDSTYLTGAFINARIGGNLKINGGNSIQLISNSFKNANTSGSVNLSGENISIQDYSLNNSHIGKIFIISGNEVLLRNSSLINVNVGNDFIILGNNFNGTNGSATPMYISGDAKIIGESILIQNNFLNNSHIGGNLIISGNSLTGQNSSMQQMFINGNTKINGENLTFQNGFLGNLNVGNDFIILGENLITQRGTAYPVQIGGDVKIIGNKLLFEYSFISSGTISKNLIISGNIITGGSVGISKLHIGGDLSIYSNSLNHKELYFISENEIGNNLYLPKNIKVTSNEFLTGTIVHGNTILGGAETILPPFTMEGDLIIEDGDNATSQMFTGTEVGSTKVYLSGELSKIGSKAYSFKQGKIQNIIRLADNYQASDIGDDAFCIAGQDPVKGITKKKFSSGEKQDLLSRTCLDLEYDGTHDLIFKIGDNEAIVEYSGEYEITVPETLNRDGYDIVGWYSDKELTQKTDINNQTFGKYEYQKTIYGKYVAQTSGENSSSGGGGRKASSDNKEHNSAIQETEIEENTDIATNDTKEGIKQNGTEEKSQKINIEYDNNYTAEQNESYTFAKSNGITTTSTIKEAKMNSTLTRIAMAKMLSNYATNVLGQEPDASKGIIKFNDVTNKLDKQYDNAVTKAYQLGIMGQNMKNNNFRPNDEVTRAEFVTALSRMLYGTEDGKGKTKYYEPHIAKLYNEGIINNTDPKMKEKRGYVMTMLMRTTK